MIRMSVVYLRTDDSRFDLDYYLTRHIPLVKDRLNDMGLIATQVEEGLAGAGVGQPPPFAVIGSLTFNTMEELQQSLAKHGAEIMGDIPNFSSVAPHIVISRVVIGAQ
jgi:uncharacterized protein (TIGR02118 family)